MEDKDDKLFDWAHSIASKAFEDVTESAKDYEELTDNLHVLRMMACNILGCMLFNSKIPENIMGKPPTVDEFAEEILSFEEWYRQGHESRKLTRVSPGPELH